MRSTCGNASWLMSPSGKLLALSFGADATTEHEMGTRRIAADFGYELSAKAGVLARKVTKLPPTFGLKELKAKSEPCILVASNLSRAEGFVKHELTFPTYAKAPAPNTACAWDDSEFAVLTRGDDRALAQELFAAFQRHDVTAGGLLQSEHRVRGLVFAVASEVPEKLILREQLALNEELERESIFERSGVKELLVRAGKSWMALRSTRWADDSKTAIRVWLNPRDQDANAYGWYTLDELAAWAEDRGPIIENSRRFQSALKKEEKAKASA